MITTIAMPQNVANVSACSGLEPVNFGGKKKKKNPHWFTDWLKDKDKVSTDGLDDGKISFGEKLKSFGKGLFCLLKSAINHPILTGATILAGAGLTVLTGGAILPVLVATGLVSGAGMIGYGAYKAATAKTDGGAKQAWETIGGGVFTVGASALGAKSSLKAAERAGVVGAEGAADLNIFQASKQTFKVTPEALKVSGLNAKGNVLTAVTGKVHAHSNKLQGAHKYMSKANEVDAYRFNPNGTPEEILANNPGVYRGADGKYYIPQSGKPDAPFLIDTTKEQMIMMYGGDDMAVCDGAIFKASYVDTPAFAKGQLVYQDPAKLPYGEVIKFTKQAPGAFTVLPEGTQVQTLEGVATVNNGDVVAIDVLGNPYVSDAPRIIKRNMDFTPEALKILEGMC